MGSPMLVLAAHGDAARHALWQMVATAKRDDLLAPVTVAVPSPHCGLSLRHELGRTGFVNVRFLAPARIAELLGAPALAAEQRRPLTTPIRTEAVHAVLAEAPAWLAPVAGHPSTEDRLAATFLDLERAGAGSRAALASRPGRVADVVGLFERFRVRTTSFYDADEVTAAAAAVVAEGLAPALAEMGHVVLYVPARLTPAEHALVEALAARDRVSAVVALTGDPSVDDAHARPLAARLARVLGDPVDAGDAPTVPRATAVLRAPDPDDEVRAVARDVLARAGRGTPLHRVAILYRTPDPYGRVVGEVLRAAGIPWSGPSHSRLADCVVGRVLLGLLELADRDFARDAVAAWLVSGPVVDPVASAADGRRRLVDAARWDVVSREAGVVAGAAQWSERLAHHLAAVDDRLARVRADDSEPEWRAHRLESDRDQVARLAAFVADLATAVAPPDAPTWASLAAWVTGLVDRYLGPESARASWPDAELDAGRRVVEALRELAALDAVGTDVDVSRFRHAVVAALDVPGERIGTFGTGVFVGSTGQAYGTAFDVVYVLGAIEGVLPPRGREDPLLPDADRRSAGNLDLHADRRTDERREYLALLAAAPEVVLCFPRADPRAQRKRLPARWLLESAEHLHGAPLTAEELRELPASDWLRVVLSFEDGFAGATDLVSIGERDLRSLHGWQRAGADLHEHALVGGDLAAGLAAQSGRGSRRLTEFDGMVGARDELAPGASYPVSPTSLQDWAECPFRYLLGSVLRLREVERPEAIETISALEEGSLVHAVLEEFVRDAAPHAPGDPWSDEERARLRAIADAHCAEAEARGVTGRRIQWQLARRRIMQTIEQFTRVDDEVRSLAGAAPTADGLEMAFGLDGAPPVTLTIGEHQVAFRGRIDRVDRTPDGSRAVVYDYKTGNPDRAPNLDDDPVVAGTKLQLPVYALAAKQLLGVPEAEAHYWYVRGTDADEALVGYAFDDGCADRFGEVVGTIVRAVAQGTFPARPGEQEWDYRTLRESFVACRMCAFDRVCPVDRGQAWERKADDAGYEPLDSLRLDDDEEPA